MKFCSSLCLCCLSVYTCSIPWNKCVVSLYWTLNTLSSKLTTPTHWIFILKCSFLHFFCIINNSTCDLEHLNVYVRCSCLNKFIWPFETCLHCSFGLFPANVPHHHLNHQFSLNLEVDHSFSSAIRFFTVLVPKHVQMDDLNLFAPSLNLSKHCHTIFSFKVPF